MKLSMIAKKNWRKYRSYFYASKSDYTIVLGLAGAVHWVVGNEKILQDDGNKDTQKYIPWYRSISKPERNKECFVLYNFSY